MRNRDKIEDTMRETAMLAVAKNPKADIEQAMRSGHKIHNMAAPLLKTITDEDNKKKFDAKAAADKAAANAAQAEEDKATKQAYAELEARDGKNAK